MKNIYGSKKYTAYIDMYLKYINENFDTFETEEEHYKFADTDIYQIVNLYTNGTRNGVLSELRIIKKDKTVFVSNCIDEPMTPFFFQHNACNYVLYRKSLYGYSILNLDSLQETNYFPRKALKEEDFIIVRAYLFKDILILDGCYWGCPYGYRFLQLETGRIFDYSDSTQEYFIASNMREPIIDGESLTIFSENYPSVMLKYDEVINLMKGIKNEL